MQIDPRQFQVRREQQLRDEVVGDFGVRKALEKTITSTTGEDYPEYYASWYDEIVPASQRLP